MNRTPTAKWHIALLAALFWLTVPLLNAAYYVWQQANHAYPSNADTIAIPIYTQTIAWAVVTPVYALLAWLVARTYRGGRSFFAFDMARPLAKHAFFASLGRLAGVCFYSVIESAVALNWIDALSFVPWVYLFCAFAAAVLLPTYEENQAMDSLSRTPAKKAHVALIALAFWVGTILTTVARIHTMFRDDTNYVAYYGHVDYVEQSIFTNTSFFAWLFATPFVGLFLWLVLRKYHGDLSFWIFDSNRPIRCVIFPILWIGFALLICCLLNIYWFAILPIGLAYSETEPSLGEIILLVLSKIFLPYVWLDSVLYPIGIYLFLCLRSSLCAPQDEYE